jgi:hypothetical protein
MSKQRPEPFSGGSLLHCRRQSCNGAAETDMKIYLLIMLIGSLLAAIHFTSAPKQQSETLPQ